MAIQQNGHPAMLQDVPQDIQATELELAVVALLNVAVSHRTCLMCGQDTEKHADGCPIFGLEQWINPASLDWGDWGG